MPNTHIWSCSKLQSHQKGLALTFTSMIGHHITNICEMALHLYLTYSSEWHIHPGGNTSYPSDEWLSPRPEPFLPQWWNISTCSPKPEHILPQWWTTLTQAGTHPTTVMKDFCTHIWPGRNWILHPRLNGPQSLTELPGNGPGASNLLESGSCPYICPTQ